jgi:hypothetical protein
MKPQIFAPGVVQEPATSLNPKLEAYWAQVEGKKEYNRVISTGTRIEDGEIAWTSARVQNFINVRRGFFQKLLKTEIDGSLHHPSGAEVISDETSPRQGHLFSLLTEQADLLSEVARRVKINPSAVIKISDQKVFMEGGVPVRVTVDAPGDASSHAEDKVLPVDKVKTQHRTVLDAIPDLIASSGAHLLLPDKQRLFELDTFRQDHVRWATLEENGIMRADESGKIGGAWMFVVPPGHPLLQTQPSMYSMNFDDTGLNPTLGVLPYGITDRWAALASIHELSHLRDAVLKIEPARGRTRAQYLEGEHKAYSVERALAFAFTQGRLQQALESVVSEALKQADTMSALNSLVNQRLPAIAQSLDTILEPNAPKSASEGALRRGLYLMLIGFEVARQMSSGNEEKQKNMEKGFIEHIYEPHGLLPKN